MIRIRPLALLATGLLVTAFAAPHATAAVIFDQGNASIQGITGAGSNQLTSPYATMDVLGDTSTGRVTFTLSASTHNASDPINSVFSQISFNTALTLGTDFTLLSATNDNGIGNGGNVSEFGAFKYTVGGPSKGSRDQPFTFTLQLADFNQALASNFTVANGLGNSFAAHMFTDVSGGVTGYIATDAVAVPEPASITLFLASLAPLGVWQVRRQRRRSAGDAV